MRYALVEQWQQKAGISQACRLLQVSRSAYYAAKQRAQTSLICAHTVHLKVAFAASGRSYGSRRLVAALKAKGIQIGRYKVRRLMRQAQIKPVWSRKPVLSTSRQHELPMANNVLNRQFNPPAPNQAWVSDMTYVRTRTGWLYLAVVLELFSRKVIGWAMDLSMTADLVCRALQMAIGQRGPSTGLIVHSDRGSQYTSGEYQHLLKRHGMTCSMSRPGNCYDNAVMERFFLSVKKERVWQGEYANPLQARRDITDYIVGFYNGVRLHSALGNLTPMMYEKKWQKKPIQLSENT